jgi:hypothetical protein
LLALGSCLPLPSPRWPPINTLHITAVGITSPAANISSNTLTASSIRPLLHHQRSPWRSQGRRHRVPASRAKAPLRTADSYAGARCRLPLPCRIAPAHARTVRVLGPHGAVAHVSESALRATARTLTRPAWRRPRSCRSGTCIGSPAPELLHRLNHVARAHFEPQTYAYTGPALLLHLCAPRCTGPPAPRFTCTSLPRRRLARCPRGPSPRRARLLPARVPHTILQRMPPPVPFHICALPAPRLRSPSSYRGRLFCLRRPSPAPVHATHHCAEPLPSARLHSPRALRSGRQPTVGALLLCDSSCICNARQIFC